mgnify:CR=1 FL=1
MIPSSFPSKDEIARLTARMLLEIGAVNFRPEDPFILASGLPSATYIDCRKLISYPRIRATLMDFLTVTIMREAGFEAFDNIAGGETAGMRDGVPGEVRVLVQPDVIDDGNAMLMARKISKKIEEDPSDPRLIVTVHRLGYKFVG